MSDIKAFREDDTFIRVECREELLLSLYEYFSFFAPNYIFDPRYKNNLWDGQIHLLRSDGRLYAGLVHKLKEYADERDLSFEADWELTEETDFSEVDAFEFAKKVIHKEGLVPHDYQIKAFIEGVRRRRTILISPTASGKSLIIYLLVWLLASKMGGAKILIVVPRIQLAHQLMGDFRDYSNGKTQNLVRLIDGPKSKSDIKERVVIAVWNSIYQLPREWFNQFAGIIGDEVHGFKAKSLRTIMEHLRACPFRIGLTGSMGKTKVHHLMLEGLFGAPLEVASYRELQDRGILANLNLRGLVLRHDRAALKRDLYTYDPKELEGSQKYALEVKYLVAHQRRNLFITKLVAGLKGNTLVLFERVEDHGCLLEKSLNEIRPGSVHFIHGKIKVKAREKAREIVEQSDDAIIVASLGSFSTGINIKRIHNIVFAFIGKAPITLLQSIGRGLRVAADKTECQLIDIADDLRLSDKGQDNYTLRHFKERMAVYREQRFSIKISAIDIGAN